MTNGFTPTEARILTMLNDGLPHPKDELKSCLFDELSENGALKTAISRLRKKLDGHDILCVFHNRSLKYQLVQTIYSANDGRT